MNGAKIRENIKCEKYFIAMAFSYIEYLPEQ
jgi:hypothetical protein